MTFPLMRWLIELRWRLNNMKVSQDATEIVEARRCTVDSDYESEYDSDDDSDYQSNKLVDYLSLGEEELIELRNRMKANREAKAKAKDNPVSEMNEPNKENSMHADNVRGETFEEHDIYMNELLKSLKTTDKDGITEDPFISVEKHVERLVKSMMVAKCGQRPPRLFDPEKGKQRKQTRYPSASIDEHTCGVKDSQLMKERGHVVAGCGRYQEYLVFKPQRHNKASCKEPVVEQTPKPKGVPGRPRKKQSVSDVEDVDVVLTGPMRDEGTGGSRGGASGSKGRGRAGGSRGGDGGSRRGKKKVGTFGFAKWFGLQDEPEQTQDEPQKTQHEPVQTQDEDQVEQTQEQAKIDLTQVEQTQEQTQDQV
ncbi:hypothetical protein Tco_0054634 [Tanacetum coccineum]